ncbi:MAG: hypothetical protein ACWA5L_05435 [bacterium]
MRILPAFILILSAIACESATEPPSLTVTLWQATGYLSPSETVGEDLGQYETAAECQKIVDAWKSKQVVGNPVSGECIAVNVTR